MTEINGTVGIDYDDDVFSTVGKVIEAVNEIMIGAGVEFKWEVDEELEETDDNYGYNETTVPFGLKMRNI